MGSRKPKPPTPGNAATRDPTCGTATSPATGYSRVAIIHLSWAAGSTIAAKACEAGTPGTSTDALTTALTTGHLRPAQNRSTGPRPRRVGGPDRRPAPSPHRDLLLA